MSQKNKQGNMKEPEWMIHYISNGVPCMCCGKIEYPYIPYICDAHTDGLTKYFNHQELQIVLDIGPKLIMYVLNVLGMRIREGEIFKNGDLVNGVIEGYPVKIMEVEDADPEDSEKCLRVIFPDEKGRFPGDDGCEELYNLQILSLSLLKNTEAQLCS